MYISICAKPKPVVEASTGGRGGGGARLTEDGEMAISLFWKFYENFHDFLKKEEIKLSNKLPI